MHNILFLIFHVAFICSLTLLFIRMGKESGIAWLSLLVIASNLFVLKQITLFSLHVTCTDALAVGYIFGLNLMQEYFGKQAARQTMWVSTLMALAFLTLSQVHLGYRPNHFDQTGVAYTALLTPLTRLMAASLATLLLVQLFDIALFAQLRAQLNGRFLTFRTTLTLALSQLLDTTLFSFLGLFGLVENVWHIIALSLALKAIIIALSAPFTHLSKRLISHVSV